jgi:hypothetical protein
MKKAIKALRGGKAEGPDEIPAEALKADIEPPPTCFTISCKFIWEEENVPPGWRDVNILKIEC